MFQLGFRYPICSQRGFYGTPEQIMAVVPNGDNVIGPIYKTLKNNVGCGPTANICIKPINIYQQHGDTQSIGLGVVERRAKKREVFFGSKQVILIRCILNIQRKFRYSKYLILE